ncbi:MAG: glycosyltransferase [Thermoleophilaceae bacterium]|nr:glycosyltransferase [Thermoleophilaceae bacterium]
MGFKVAQVSPYPLEQHHEVNLYIEQLSDELCKRGHQVVVVGPSDSRELVRSSRKAIKERDVFASEGCANVLGVGASLPFPPARRSGSVSLPLDVSRTIEELLETAGFDFVHVHEPFAPSASSAALRHSRALNVGTFHGPAERVLSTQVARPLVELFFGRLDGRVTSSAATRSLMERFFPGTYEVIGPGTDGAPLAHPESGEIEIAFCLEEERSALRLFLRALRRLPIELPWKATVWSRLPGSEPTVPLARALRGRVRFCGPAEGPEGQLLARADVAVAASNGAAPAPGMVLRAIGGGAVPVVSALPVYTEALDDGERGLEFDARDPDQLAAQLRRLVEDRELRNRFRKRLAEDRAELGWDRAAERVEEIYERIAARRHPAEGNSSLRKKLARRDFIHVDLHMHTDHSHDCATPVDTLVETAKERGLGAIAVTDHNEISGALEARERAQGLKIIVAEEVKTAEQGEVIGLFIEEKVPRGLTLEETIAEIHRQGGLAYVPHPFDRMHSVPDYEHLLTVVEDIDAIEVFNPRVAFSAFNEEAERFAAKYRVVAGAGSDSHVAQGLGSVKIRMRDFDGPEEFLESLREADIIRKKQSLLYVQALKFIQTRSKSGTKQRKASKT